MAEDSNSLVIENEPYEPKRPALVASGLMTLWVSILSIPMLQGRFLARSFSDQYHTGFAYRSWGAEQWLETGQVPLWNPYIMGGLPYVAGQHGDILYPTAWLRLLLPIDVGMNLGFFLHYILAGIFTYAFLRAMKCGWVGAVVGGLAYQLSGIIASYPSPGHDGKLFVSALLPLALLGLTWAIRDRKYEGYGLVALTVGLSLLSPHYQMTQYALLTMGLFALYLAFDERSRSGWPRFAGTLGVASIAVVVGFGVAAIQVLPFFEYLPFSTRSEAVRPGFEWATSYAIPWDHVPEFFLGGFVGSSLRGYWGPNPIKFHSEYLGLAVVALSILGASSLWRTNRKLVWWLGGIATLFLLVALGGSTPFYRLWWSVVPYVKSTRAAGMAFFIVAFAVAVFAGFGAQQLATSMKRGQGRVMFGVGALIALLGVAGVWSSVAVSFAEAYGPQRIFTARNAEDFIRWSAVASGVGLASLGGAIWLRSLERINAKVFGLALVAIVGTDLWFAARPFWVYSDPNILYGGDRVTEYFRSLPEPRRVWNEPGSNAGYPQASLMAYRVADLVGYHGFEIDAYKRIVGNGDVPVNILNPNVWDLYGVNHLVFRSGLLEQLGDSIPGFDVIFTDEPVVEVGQSVTVLERRDPSPWARITLNATLVPADQAAPTVLLAGFPTRSLVVLDDTANIQPAPITDQAQLQAIGPDVQMESWAPGQMRFSIANPADRESYLVVSENYYPDWRAFVDGISAPVYRGNGSLITVPLPAGASEIELEFVSDAYSTGKGISLASLGIILLGLVGPIAYRRKRRSAE